MGQIVTEMKESKKERQTERTRETVKRKLLRQTKFIDILYFHELFSHVKRYNK